MSVCGWGGWSEQGRAGRLPDPVGTLSRAGRRPRDAPEPPRVASEPAGRTKVNCQGAPQHAATRAHEMRARAIDCSPIQPLQTPRSFSWNVLELVSKVAFVVGGLEASGSGSRLADPVGTLSRAGIRSREAPWLARLFARAQGRRRSGCRATPIAHHQPLRPTTRPQAIRDLRTPRHF